MTGCADDQRCQRDQQGQPGGAWRVEHRSGTAQELHDAGVPDDARLVRVNEVTDRALVLGSTQAESSISTDGLDRGGLTLARRRSGGGAVVLTPGSQHWVDIVIPAHDPLWVDDVERSSWWLGSAWARSLTPLTGPDHAPQVHRSGLVDRDLSRVACFAGTGPGEVGVAGRKVVGISQRRTRTHARFQCVAYVRWNPTLLVACLPPGELRSRIESVLSTEVGDLAWLRSTARSNDGGDLSATSTPPWSVAELIASLP